MWPRLWHLLSPTTTSIVSVVPATLTSPPFRLRLRAGAGREGEGSQEGGSTRAKDGARQRSLMIQMARLSTNVLGLRLDQGEEIGRAVDGYQAGQVE